MNSTLYAQGAKVKRYVLHCCSLMLLGGLFAPSAQAESLHEAVQYALDSNPELAAIRRNREAIDHELRAARGLRLPTLDVKSGWGRHRDGLRSGNGIVNSDDWHNQKDVGLTASQRIFDGFEAVHEIARQKNRVESARWRVADTANSIALRVVQAYLEVQRASAVLAAARSNLSQLRSIGGRVDARVDAGKGNAADGTQAGARIANAQAMVAEARGRLEDARALYRAVVGKAPGNLLYSQPPRAHLPNSIDAAVAEAEDAAPSVIATQHDTVAAEAAIASARSRFLPKLNAEVSTYHGKGIDERGDRDLDARALLVVRWNLFNGGIDRARVYEAAARAAEAAEISANTQRIVARETRVSWNAMVAAGRRIPALSRELELTRSTRATYSEQFVAGKRRLLDLLDIQNEVFVADASLRTEQFVGRYNTYRVLAAVGRLVPALGLELPYEAEIAADRTILDGWAPSIVHAQ